MFAEEKERCLGDKTATRERREEKEGFGCFNEGKVGRGARGACAYPASFGFDVGPAAAGINLSGGGKRKKNFFVFVDGKRGREGKRREEKEGCGCLFFN